MQCAPLPRSIAQLPSELRAVKTAGVQVGEMVRVTASGVETLHTMPRGLFRSGQSI